MPNYTLYLDKSNKFSCKISLEGASLKSAEARLVLENLGKHYLFPGTITEAGDCSIQIDNLREFLKPTATGNLQLEIIADDVYFKPWKTRYIADVSKKITVEVASPTESKKPKLSVVVETPQQKEFKMVVNEALKLLRAHNVGITSLSHKKKIFGKCLNDALSHATFKHNHTQLISEIVKTLA
jgi:hypothetical protein